MNPQCAVVATLLVFGALLGSAGSASAVEPGPKCEALKNKHAGKYSYCRAKATAKSILKSDPADFQKCNDKLDKVWGKLSDKFGDLCPSTDDLEDIRTALVSSTSGLENAFSGGAVPGDLDIVFAYEWEPNVYCSSSYGVVCSEVDSSRSDGSRDVALGDLNGDGLLDAVFANESDPNRVCISQPGTVPACADVSVDSFDTSDVALGDLNHDGDLDAVFVSTGDRKRVCMGDGAGGFVGCTDLDAAYHTAEEVVLVDLNGDGNLDAVLAQDTSDLNRVCLGDGVGGFGACTAISDDWIASMDVAVADVDQDGKLDAVFASYFGDENLFCLGNGAGGFSACAPFDSGKDEHHGVAVGDFDEGGPLEVLLADWAGFTGPAYCEYVAPLTLSCGDLSLVAGTPPGVDLTSKKRVAAHDLDGDGHLDAVFSGANGSPHAMCLGNGAGQFLCSNFGSTGDETGGLAIGDLD